jgi:hypothetical protein
VGGVWTVKQERNELKYNLTIECEPT